MAVLIVNIGIICKVEFISQITFLSAFLVWEKIVVPHPKLHCHHLDYVAYSAVLF